MRIVFEKRSDDRHVLRVVRGDGSVEEVSCETRSYLVHDFLHYALESEVGLESGFWGSLARGKTFAELDDRTGASLGAQLPELMEIEGAVGPLSGLVKGTSPAELMSSFERVAETTDSTVPRWLTVEVIEGVAERMRRLLGHWRATPYRGEMVLEWPAR